MWRILIFAVSIISLAGDTAFSQSKLSIFSGDWLRDDVVTTEGKHLPRVIWHIRFDETTMTLAETLQDGRVIRKVKCNIDGTETYSDIPNYPKRKSSHKFVWNEPSQSIEVTHIIPGSRDFPTTATMIITEIWRVSNDGMTLKMLRKTSLPDIPVRVADVSCSFRKMMAQRQQSDSGIE